MNIHSCENSRGLRPIWCAEEMELEYDVTMLPFPPRVLKPEYLDINPLGTIPFLEDGHVKMTESVGMCIYLVEKYGPTDLSIQPEEADYHLYLNWLTHADATLTFPQTVVLRYTIQEPGVADAAAEGYRRWFVSRLKMLESSLSDREFLCSDRFTIADICVSYAIFLAKQLNIEQAMKPNITRWTTALFERPAFKRAHAHKYIETSG